MSIAELQVYGVEAADAAGGVCRVRCVGGVARAGQVYAAGESRVRLRSLERYGRTAEECAAGHIARAHLAGAVVALLSPGQVLTYVPPGGHALAEVEAWLATGPPLLEEPHPEELRTLATGRMQDESLPGQMRLRWGRVALAALDRAARPEERPYVRAYLLRSFGPGPDCDPAALCREVLARFDLTPEEAAERARAWRELPRPEIRRLRGIKNLIPCTAPARPYLDAAGPLAAAVDAWTALRPRLP